MEKVKIGVVGLGKLGRLHTALLKEISKIDFVGLYDTRLPRMKEVSGEFEVQAFPSLEALLDAVDALVIAVPTQVHAEVALPALHARKHIFIEKPITATLEEADSLLRAAQENAVKIQVGHIERFNPAFLALQDETLMPMFIETHRLASFDPRGTDVAVVLDLMIHDIDLILSLVKSPIEMIDATGVAVASREADIANARIRFKNGCVANLTASRISLKKMRKMRIFQKDAYLTLDFLQKQAEIYRLKDVVPSEKPEHLAFNLIGQRGFAKKILYEKRTQENLNALKEELSAFVTSILEDSTPLVTGDDGRKALDVALQIMRQVHEHAKLYQM
ncbi:4-carboxy-2-hydroxymuconate-6-semialdehyde dehydrogenase [bacterium BMS3Abin05]|nr:4-carboxy-2-hydroxymuconate-6-semialdehyde dehydrogenase [bacterium BMS3Abin05]GBE28720.1 4-carboxy-2-hydroxymuconate-6-semialdehyde dehydrogenase [bacterium BMS3Bbin03]